MSGQISGAYLLFLGNCRSKLDAKTANGILQWRPDRCIAQFRLSEDAVDIGLPDMNPAEAVASGGRTMVIGIAPIGGAIQPEWVQPIIAALEAGMDVAAGMHSKLSDHPDIAAAARANGRKLFDVRHASGKQPIATGVKRAGRRLLTVGTDCASGKKYTALAVHAEMAKRGLKATFRATGQTGILIAGEGVAIDAVVSDFAAGAAESLSPNNHSGHWDVIEGQGSLFHPAYAGVSLSLLHGSQPDAIIVCHEPGRQHIDDLARKVFDPALIVLFDAFHVGHSSLYGIGVNQILLLQIIKGRMRVPQRVGKAAVLGAWIFGGLELARGKGLLRLDIVFQGFAPIADLMFNNLGRALHHRSKIGLRGLHEDFVRGSVQRAILLLLAPQCGD